MDRLKPGYTVQFKGLKAAGHLNGTEGTLVRYLKKEHRWSVRCAIDNQVVNAKTENLQRVSLPSGGKENREHQQDQQRLQDRSCERANNLLQKEQYEWFSNCYQLRCDDDYQWGGCYLHGPYLPEATPQSIADDFLIYCVLAHRAKTLPAGWDWRAFLKLASEFVTFAFEKSDAQERWGSKSHGLRSMGAMIYKSDVTNNGKSREHKQAIRDVQSNKMEIQQQLGGVEAWRTFARDLGLSNRFASY
mmetsp:Transcript_1102/g.1948  ORF Transcript_1102/g.1948 Transcript_1102/m.1948 type:complete len:246 (+) Transcript_1102:108-845(+)|eukprot:CAMPEP_0178753144 /NCGR_PEP_ID=MMETSP0744-20121128/11453_1 /TAXON_ID=913974 /ORGANISM="Nitzschia punctata, Strain CCMP561" /LENGTH=245 /DNA_ID=CAMNT_0020406937 /DNA_START=12 /DNA_END=749 /DNA_ORIENTATION=-